MQLFIAAVQREWQLAELLRQKLAEEPDREASRLAASGGRLMPRLRSSRLGHLTPQHSPLPLPVLPRLPVPLKSASPSSPLPPTSGFAQHSLRQLSCNVEIGAVASSGSNGSVKGCSGGEKGGHPRRHMLPSRSMRPPCARALSLVPHDGLPLSRQLSAHRQRRMQRQAQQSPACSTKAGNRGSPATASKAASFCQPTADLTPLPHPSRSTSKRHSDGISRSTARRVLGDVHQQVTPPECGQVALALEQQARAHDEVKVRH